MECEENNRGLKIEMLRIRDSREIKMLKISFFRVVNTNGDSKEHKYCFKTQLQQTY
jgi:hypothetical protein